MCAKYTIKISIIILLFIGCSRKTSSNIKSPPGCISVDFFVDNKNCDDSTLSSILKIPGEYPNPPIPSTEMSENSGITHVRKNILRSNRSRVETSEYFLTVISNLDYEELKKTNCKIVKITLSDESGILEFFDAKGMKN
jgi:hypothetical protein